MENKFILGLLSIISAFLVAASCAFGADGALRIGFILPLSGEWAELGAGIRDAALLAQQDLAEQGQKVEFKFEDNRGDLALSAALGQRLIDGEQVDALVSIISGVGRILKNLAGRARIIHVGICSELEVADGQFSFINYLTAAQGVSKYLEYFRSSYGEQRSLAIFSMNESGFQRIVDELSARAGGSLRIASKESFDKGAIDFRALLLRGLRDKPDVVLLLGLSPEIEILARQLRALHFDQPMTSIEGIGLANDKSAFEGAWFVDSAVPSKAFRERFLASYGRPVSPGVGHAYDTVRMLAQAFRGAKTRSAAIESFRTLRDFSGVIGSLTVKRDGVIWSAASIKKVRAGKVELVE